MRYIEADTSPMMRAQRERQARWQSIRQAYPKMHWLDLVHRFYDYLYPKP